jgi:phage gpG-like protein
MINWNLGRQLAIESFNEMVDEFAQEINFQIEDTKWNWPRETVRKNGSVVGSPRNIVDTGELKNSQFIEDVSDTYKVIGYTADHATLVYEGYQIERSDGKITNVPARPFIDTAIEDYNPIEAYSEILKEKLNE